MVNREMVQGNRLVLLGAIWYLLEFAVIIPFNPPALSPGSSAAEILTYYAANRFIIPLYVVGVSAAILGRLAFISGLRAAPYSVSDARPLLDLAFASCIVAVTMETIGLAQPPLVIADELQNAWVDVTQLFVVPHGLFVAAAALAMLRIPALPKWIGWVGLVGGGSYALTVNPGPYFDSVRPLLENLNGFAWLFIIVWMLATGIVLFRRLPQPDSVSTVVAGAD